MTRTKSLKNHSNFTLGNLGNAMKLINGKKAKSKSHLEDVHGDRSEVVYVRVVLDHAQFGVQKGQDQRIAPISAKANLQQQGELRVSVCLNKEMAFANTFCMAWMVPCSFHERTHSSLILGGEALLKLAAKQEWKHYFLKTT